MTTTQCTCTGCAVQQGTHQPSEALHQQIDEPQTQQPEALRLADALAERVAVTATGTTFDGDLAYSAAELRAQHARIAELEAEATDNARIIGASAETELALRARVEELERELVAVGAGGVEPLRKQVAPPIAWPKDAQDVRDFFHADFITAQFAAEDLTPCDEDRYLISAHDFLSAVNWWADFPHIPRTPGTAPSAAPVPDERAAFEAWLGIKPCGAAHDFGWAAWRARAALAATQPAAQGMEQEYIKSQHQLAEMTARAEHAEAKAAEEQEHAAFYRWMRDQNDWYAEPRIDAADGTVWKLTMYSPQEIMAPDDDDGLDAAIRSALAAQAKQGEQANG